MGRLQRLEPIAARMEWIRPRSTQSSDEFVREYREAVYRIALSITGRQDVAEDVTQEALLRGLKHRAKLDDPERWLKGVAARRAMTAVQSRPLQGLTEDIHVPVSEDGVAVREVLAKLSAEHQTLLALSISEGWTYEEIADALGSPQGTVASRLHAAKE